MKISRIIIWAGFLAILLVFIYYNRFFTQAAVHGLLCIGSPDAEKGKALIGSWDNAQLLPVARRMNWFDFAFIFFYIAIIITLSNRQIRKEPSVIVNAMLRANFFFAVAAGLLDITENIFLLYNTYHWNDGHYINVWWVTWLKFILAGWAVLVWLVSFVKTGIK